MISSVEDASDPSALRKTIFSQWKVALESTMVRRTLLCQLDLTTVKSCSSKRSRSPLASSRVLPWSHGRDRLIVSIWSRSWSTDIPPMRSRNLASSPARSSVFSVAECTIVIKRYGMVLCVYTLTFWHTFFTKISKWLTKISFQDLLLLWPAEPVCIFYDLWGK